ncbi:TadE family protein [Sinomonas sp. G460-2]|uniref:TadE family protein n=1 Tax=Sinomonas sp. G460-2 TaxID=3393464 RepID=UPI0039EE3494
MNGSKNPRERGAVAVEFALVAPLFLAILVAIIEFSNFFRVQISVTQAAREAARAMAISNDQTAAKAAAAAASPGIDPSGFSYAFSPSSCSSGQTVQVTITYSLNDVSGGALQTLTGAVMPGSVTGVSAMRCGG